MYRMLLRALIAPVLLVACGEAPTETSLAPSDASYAPAAGFRNVMLKPNAPQGAVNAGAPLVRTVADAVDRVAPNGRIKVSPGTYVAEGAVIDKPVTFELQGDGAVVFQTTQGDAGITVTNGVSVSLSGIDFENTGANASVYVTGDGSAATIAEATFTVDGGYAGSWADGGASLTVSNSAFTGGAYAVIAQTGELVLRENEIAGQQWASVYMAGAQATIADNVMTDCGDEACIQAFGGATGSISGNVLSNARTGPGPVDEGSEIPEWAFFHHVILVFTGADMSIVDNEIDGCGWGQCIATGVGAHALIEGNRITAYADQGTRLGIVVGDGAGGASGDPALGSTAVIRNNELIGVGDPSADRWNRNLYGFRLPMIQAEGVGSSLIAENNTGSNGEVGISARSGASVTGSGNVFSQTRIGAAIWEAGSAMALHTSDFTDYLIAIEQFDNDQSSLTCNYWGDAGPQNVQIHGGQGASLFMPWAVAPIAASGDTGLCSGGASPL